MTTNVLASKDFKTADDFRLFPNPSNGIVSFAAHPVAIETIHIYDFAGRLVMQTAHNTANEIDLGGLRDGVYFVLLKGDGHRSTQKMILKH
jgi:hypothetical protein